MNGIGDACDIDLPTLDIDKNGLVTPETDAMIVLRYLFGLRGSAMINGLIDLGNGQRTSPEEITNYLDTYKYDMLDVDQNGEPMSLTDGMLIIRYLNGLRGNSLIQGVVDPTGLRTTAEQIEVFLEQFTTSVSATESIAETAEFKKC